MVLLVGEYIGHYQNMVLCKNYYSCIIPWMDVVASKIIVKYPWNRDCIGTGYVSQYRYLHSLSKLFMYSV